MLKDSKGEIMESTKAKLNECAREKSDCCLNGFVALENGESGNVEVRERELAGGVRLFSVTNGKVSFSVMNLGCTITELFVPDRDGRPTDIVLACDTLTDFENCHDSRGAVVGRVANRISKASFILDGKKYELDKNDGDNTLHGGNTRFEKMIWNAEPFERDEGGLKSAGVVFTRKSPSGEQGFPGNMDLTVEYRLDSNGNLSFDYRGISDQRTPVSITNHSYFNLDGAFSDKLSILDHEMKLDSHRILEIDGNLIPSGKILDVSEKREFDFTNWKRVGQDIEKCDKRIGQGYDHCFVTSAFDDGKKDGLSVKKFGSIKSKKTGIIMDIFTDQIGMQVYSGNFLEGSGKGGLPNEKYGAICFESQRLVDAVNRKEFPSMVQEAGEMYKSLNTFKFSVEGGRENG